MPLGPKTGEEIGADPSLNSDSVVPFARLSSRRDPELFPTKTLPSVIAGFGEKGENPPMEIVLCHAGFPFSGLIEDRIPKIPFRNKVPSGARLMELIPE